MRYEFGNKLKSQSQIIKNFSFLAAFELINLIFPILITPFIIKTIGIESFGKVSFLQAILMTLCVITDWGFNISAIRDISANRDNIGKLSEEVSNIFNTKLLLLLFVFILYLFFVFFSQDYFFYSISFFLIIGKTIYPNWLFIGLEKNQYLILGSIASNSIYAIFVFLFIKGINDYKYILFLQGTSMVLVYIFLLFKSKTMFNLSYSITKKIKIKEVLKNNYPIFLSNLSLTSSSYASTIILKFFISEYSLGVFSLAQKISSISKLGLTIFSSSIYPRVSISILDKTNQKLKAIFKNIYFPYAILFVSLTLMALFLIKPILLFFDPLATSEHLLIVSLLFILPIITLFNLMPYLILLSHKKDKIYSKIMIFSAILTLVSLLILVPIFKIYGALISSYFVEIFIVIGLFLKSKEFFPKFNL